MSAPQGVYTHVAVGVGDHASSCKLCLSYVRDGASVAKAVQHLCCQACALCLEQVFRCLTQSGNTRCPHYGSKTKSAWQARTVIACSLATVSVILFMSTGQCVCCHCVTALQSLPAYKLFDIVQTHMHTNGGSSHCLACIPITTLWHNPVAQTCGTIWLDHERAKPLIMALLRGTIIL